VGSPALPEPRALRFPDRPCGYHAVAGDAEFTAFDCVCRHGVRSPRAEGSHRRAKICVMLDGAFHMRTRQGSLVVGAGALVLGTAGAGYEYRHLEDGGDRSVSFEYHPALLDDLPAAGFRRAAVPPSPALEPIVALAHEALCSGDREALREVALAVAAIAISAERGDRRPLAAPAAQSRRITEALRYIEAHFAGDCTLDTLAARARLSSFHFLRSFRAITGQTPRQVVIATRLRAAAALLRTTQRPILDVAFEAGFGDASHFMASFARAFGTSPGGYRRGAAAR
jgi:AraC-like DNA-binding protein